MLCQTSQRNDNKAWRGEWDDGIVLPVANLMADFASGTAGLSRIVSEIFACDTLTDNRTDREWWCEIIATRTENANRCYISCLPFRGGQLITHRCLRICWHLITAGGAARRRGGPWAVGGDRQRWDSANGDDTHIRRHEPHSDWQVTLQRLVPSGIPTTTNKRPRTAEIVRISM